MAIRPRFFAALMGVRMRKLIGLILVFGGIALMLKDAPRVLFDYQHAEEFVVAHDLKITSAKCTNWSLAILDRCIVEYATREGEFLGSLTDWKFGRASSDPIHLLKWRNDPSVVTTDMSLESVRNRLVFAVTVALGGMLFLVAMTAKIMQRARAQY